ncbi:DUF924 family protein [Granulosicoccaceae sp. 1_MG-2023]|nr:DUF924 family protein [Granulosicoccaceae sp. 1_MG-2023]
MDSKIDRLYEFWFAGVTPVSIPASASKRWFAGGAALDRRIRDEFGDWVRRAAEGEFDNWQASAKGTLALLLLLDQFPLNIFRGTAQAYAYEERALTCCHRGLAAGQDRQLGYAERIFFYLPLEHAENAADQARSVALFSRLAAGAPPELKAHARATLGYAEKHRDIINTFGRFPHRNAVLGRPQTAAESAFLQDRANRFGQ